MADKTIIIKDKAAFKRWIASWFPGEAAEAHREAYKNDKITYTKKRTTA